MNIAITGGSGLVGKELIRALVADGYGVTALEHSTLVAAADVMRVRGDIRDRGCVEKLVEDCDAVIKLSSAKWREEVFIETNLRGCTTCWRSVENGRAGDSSTPAEMLSMASGITRSRRSSRRRHPPTAYPDRYALSLVLEDTMCGQYEIMYKMPITVIRPSWILPANDPFFVRHFMSQSWERYLDDQEKAELKEGRYEAGDREG